MITENAYAKINLQLHILGLRKDGYHEVDMLMQTLDWHDTLHFYKTTHNQIELDCDCSELNNHDNLVWRAADLLRRKSGITQGVKIILQKEIFAAAGLAGGSSDAGATLRGCNRLWNLNYSFEKLEEIGAELGSDIPFLIQGGTARAKGRGEILTHYNNAENTIVVLAKPKNISISTKWAYAEFDKLPKDIEQEDLGNTLELAIFPAYPVLANMKEAAQNAGAEIVLMSGSGPTMYALCDNMAEATKIYDVWQKFETELRITRFTERIRSWKED
ncbi:MAG: 4-(cytidine 5'-diphospho)-2-C-methyl-D-erythritol kinase [Phascolarctobacterium sp.]|nr:4-(cytidine 5'-diphospho)-2-C-methyl-D-erythritol kinase [Phascolarctobacterium sp.]